MFAIIDIIFGQVTNDSCHNFHCCIAMINFVVKTTFIQILSRFFRNSLCPDFIQKCWFKKKFIEFNVYEQKLMIEHRTGNSYEDSSNLYIVTPPPSSYTSMCYYSSYLGTTKVNTT